MSKWSGEKLMEKTDFNYTQKPAFISFLLTFVLCLGIGFLLIGYSPLISPTIAHQLGAYLPAEGLDSLVAFPFGTALSLPFLLYALHTILWSLMSRYEINPSGIRLLSGTLVRKERFFPISNFCQVSFKQNLLEAPLEIGQVILRRQSGSRVVIKGVRNVESVAQALRAGVNSPRHKENRPVFTQTSPVSPSAPRPQQGTVGWVIAFLCFLGFPLALVYLFKAELLTEFLDFFQRLFNV
jgi:membrane protein YdbS with pleckstrin-like domain